MHSSSSVSLASGGGASRFTKNMKIAVLVLLILMIFSAPVLEAASITLPPVADTTLQESFPTNNFGGGTTVDAGGRRYGGRTRALLRFDLASSIPSNAIITAVTVTLTVVATPLGGVNSVFDLNRLLAAWGEGNGSDHRGTPGGAGEATWNNRFGSGTPWASPGGDFQSTASASQLVASNAVYTFNSTAGLVSDVQGWVNDPASNFGWLLRSESETSPTTIRRFGARTDVVNSPALIVSYFMPPRIQDALAAGGRFQFQFQAVAGRSNVVERRAGLNAELWQTITNIPPPAMDTNVLIADLAGSSNAFYRVRLP